MKGYTIAIVGRPNVGKSTFFNRMLEQRKAIVDDISGVTRDRQYGITDWNGKTFNVIDTGGFVPESQDIFEKEIKKQVLVAIEEADAIVFVVSEETKSISIVSGGHMHPNAELSDVRKELYAAFGLKYKPNYES